MNKQATDLSPGHEARNKVPKSEFAMPSKHPKGHSEAKGKYPMPDKAHERAALGFAAMHHGKDSAEYKAVERKAEALRFKEAFERGFLKAAWSTQNIKDTLKMIKTDPANKTLEALLPFTALGATSGGALGYFSSDKHKLRNTLLGAIGGGGVGLGGALLANTANDYKNIQDSMRGRVHLNHAVSRSHHPSPEIMNKLREDLHSFDNTNFWKFLSGFEPVDPTISSAIRIEDTDGD